MVGLRSLVFIFGPIIRISSVSDVDFIDSKGVFVSHAVSFESFRLTRRGARVEKSNIAQDTHVQSHLDARFAAPFIRRVIPGHRRPVFVSNSSTRPNHV